MDFLESTIKTYSGLSSETKPTIAGGTDVPNGSRFREVDTGKTYVFNLSDDVWYMFGQQIVVESNGGIPVNIQDQTTPPVMLPMAQELLRTITTSNAVVNSYTVDLASVAGASVGDHIRVISPGDDRYYFGTILGIATNTIALDTQIDFAYPSGSEVTVSNINMAVNGSVTPVIFSLRTGLPSIPSNMDITRLLITCLADSAVDLNKFGNLPALTRGLAFRHVNARQNNIFNIKTNKDIAALAYDWTPYAATNPAQGADGFISRLTFAGQNKIGVSLRVEQTGNLEMLVQDDLSDLVNLRVTLEGHVVEGN